MDTKNPIWQAIFGFLLIAIIASNHADAAIVDIKTKGAKGDGVTDDSQAIVSAWNETCQGPAPRTLLIPPGTYMVLPTMDLNGPCSGPITIKATGATIKAPPELARFLTNYWISISNVDRLTMIGGTYDGQGQDTWRLNLCPDGGPPGCPLPVNLRLTGITNSLLKYVTSTDSKFFHMRISGCNNTRLDHITITSPTNSVNTDGITISRLTGLNITNSVMSTNDDCISIGPGSRNVRIRNIMCGPGDGIGIGSLGRRGNDLPVQGLWIKNVTMTGTEHGFRIKTWPTNFTGIVSDLHYEDVIMNNVSFPIFFDQNFCPLNDCQNGTASNVAISNVTFRNIKGTSATKVALKFDCSAAVPCKNVKLADIKLTYKGPEGGPATSECANMKPKVVGKVVPRPACPGLMITSNTKIFNGPHKGIYNDGGIANSHIVGQNVTHKSYKIKVKAENAYREAYKAVVMDHVALKAIMSTKEKEAIKKPTAQKFAKLWDSLVSYTELLVPSISFANMGISNGSKPTKEDLPHEAPTEGVYLAASRIGNGQNQKSKVRINYVSKTFLIYSMTDTKITPDAIKALETFKQPFEKFSHHLAELPSDMKKQLCKHIMHAPQHNCSHCSENIEETHFHGDIR
ncbi:hypothetical protein LXL04_038012 [Taraxacum kok-saghyz]